MKHKPNIEDEINELFDEQGLSTADLKELTIINGTPTKE
jgi:hypothetical protein